MPTEWIDYPDQKPGWENTLWRFVKGAWDGEDIPTGPDAQPIHVLLEYTAKGNNSAWTTKLENGSMYYRNNSDTNEGKFAGYIKYNDPTTDYCEIVFGSYYYNNTSVQDAHYALSNALSGTLTLSDGNIVDVPTNAAAIGGMNYGASIALNVPQSLGYTEWQFRKERINEISISANFPIFENKDALDNYIVTGSLDGCINLEERYELQTKTYYIFNNYGSAKQERGTITPTGGKNWRSMKFMSNSIPVMYYNDNSYALTLIADDVVCSISRETPGYILDNFDISIWSDDLEYTGNWYGYFSQRNRARGVVLPDGNYTYGFSLSTNIYIFKDRATAEDAKRRQDFRDAVNYPDIVDPGKPHPALTPEDQTDFGPGADTSPFVTSYVLSRTNVYAIANVWYNTDGQILQNILDGLKMYSNPTDAIAGLMWYPFDVNSLVYTQPTNTIHFGSYAMIMESSSFYYITGNKSGGYIDCGTVFLRSLFNSYQDFTPYTHLSLYLPFIGWQDVDIRPLINKNVSIRYYVDIHTGTCTAVLLANGTFITYYNGNIGVQLPISAPDFQGYANSALNSILKNATSALNPAQAIQVGSAGGPVAAAASAATGIAKSTLQGCFELEKLGQPRDHLITKGNFTAGIGSYMPPKILWRYDIHYPIEPSNFNTLNGRPSSASGPVSSFSGFLKVSSASLNTSGMLDAEVAEVATLLKTGIFA